MLEKAVIIFNEPAPGPHHQLGESVDSVREVRIALHELGYQVQTLALRPPLSLAEAELKRIQADLVFNLFEGFEGWPESEAAIVQYLDDFGFCYTGSSSFTLRVCENKSIMKTFLSKHGIATPQWQVMYPGCTEKIKISFPCIVKPIGEHASYGLSSNSVVHNLIDLKQQIEFIWQTYRRYALVEKFLPGREFRVTLIENHYLHMLPIEEIIYNLPANMPELLTYSAKWIKEDMYFKGTSEKCPAEIDTQLNQKIENIAKSAYFAVKCYNYASIDLRQNEAGTLMVIDINPNPDISLQGGMKYPIEAMGISYSTFITQIISTPKRDRHTANHSEPDMSHFGLLDAYKQIKNIESKRSEKRIMRKTHV
jgi:D-alanine-D-alanine ligase